MSCACVDETPFRAVVKVVVQYHPLFRVLVVSTRKPRSLHASRAAAVGCAPRELLRSCVSLPRLLLPFASLPWSRRRCTSAIRQDAARSLRSHLLFGALAGPLTLVATDCNTSTTSATSSARVLDFCFDALLLFLPCHVNFSGVIPFWAFLERVERVPLATGGGGASRPGPRERRLSSVRNTVGAVASLGKVSTPLGRARAWIRQCLVSKCLEACVAALLEEERLVKVRNSVRETDREARRIRVFRYNLNLVSLY